MLSFLPGALKGVLALLLMVLNTFILIQPLLIATFCKLLVPIACCRKPLSGFITGVAVLWNENNGRILALTQSTRLDVTGVEDLNKKGWYLVCCNHQSWSDILILQWVLNHRIPGVKYFLKQQLIWLPLLGLAFWALDFPFMRRYSKEYLTKFPENRGKDLETTKQACKKFREIPVSVVNFLEGTRFTQAKHKVQQSPYRYLLKPKTGGVAYTLAAMGGQLRCMLDVTIVYHNRAIGFWDLLCGRIHRISVHVEKRTIPEAFAFGDYDNDPEFRTLVQEWVSGIWYEKDKRITRMKGKAATNVLK